MSKIRKINIDKINIDNTYLEIKGKGWRSEEFLSIKELISLIDIDVSNIKDVNVVELDSKPSKINPDKITMSIDENYLYIWSNKHNRWKRVPLSDF